MNILDSGLTKKEEETLKDNGWKKIGFKWRNSKVRKEDKDKKSFILKTGQEALNITNLWLEAKNESETIV